MQIAAVVTLAAVPSAPVSAFERTETRAPCNDYRELRRPLFGDLHVHTTLSFDAWGQGTRNTPRDAYRFARGETLGVQPYRADGSPLRTLTLKQPLDFAMVSDHSEMTGETQLCRTPGSASYASLSCALVRRWPALGYAVLNSQWTKRVGHAPDICGDDGRLCHDRALGAWKVTQEAAEEFYDRTPECRFTTFVGYEWSSIRLGMNHRNVVFRNAEVTASPNNAIDDQHNEVRLWTALRDDCLNADSNCDVLTIPHNSNLSRGDMFWVEHPDAGTIDRELAELRATMEPLIEITQHKGDSECRLGGRDELCNFETVSFGDVAGHASPMHRMPPAPGVFVREALTEGLALRSRLGVNPYKLGIIGSTDTHLGTPGYVAEKGFVGHAAGSVTARLKVSAMPDHPVWNPGGLAGVWAEENSRDSIFEAMRRRETFGTSGPRIVVRLFGGWAYDKSMCQSSDFATIGYDRGVAMGGDLPDQPELAKLAKLPAPADAAPSFAVFASRDPIDGHVLERVQIIKGWIDANGAPRERVFDVAGEVNPDASVDMATCTPRGEGHDQLCSVWSDPEFDPGLASFYYARVLENPTCRWTWHACLAAGVDCDGTFGPRGHLAACCDEQVPKTIRERAWTSPIWYTPADDH